MWQDANIPTQGDKSTCRRQAPSSAEHVPSPPIGFGAQPMAWCAITFQILIAVLAACSQVFMPTPAQAAGLFIPTYAQMRTLQQHYYNTHVVDVLSEEVLFTSHAPAQRSPPGVNKGRFAGTFSSGQARGRVDEDRLVCALSWLGKGAWERYDEDEAW